MNRFSALTKTIIRYLKYYFRAQTRYAIHPPFVRKLIDEVIEDDRWYYIFEKAEILRSALLRDDRIIRITDHGAGSQINPSSERKISDITRHSAIAPQHGRLLFRLVNFHKPDKILELGTSFGISGMYQKAGALSGTMYTIEGCPNTAAIANEMFNYIELPNIHQLVGPFRDMLPKALSSVQQLSFLYLDGDHRKDASLEYFNACLPYAHENSLFVIADIYWSDEMASTWATMKAHPQVSLSIDLFHFGLLYFGKQQYPEKHYTFIKSWYKPWQLLRRWV